MATQAYIIEAEGNIIASVSECEDIRKAFLAEIVAAGDGNGLYVENSDCWGTLAVNLRTLSNKAGELADLINARR
jgi:hypothetical protein